MKVALVFFALALLAGGARAYDKVSVALYYESLCPYCEAFITGPLSAAWAAADIQEITDLTLVPYGNAKEAAQGSSYTYTCQHGTNECIGNFIETCAINILKNVTVYYPFIKCLEASGTPYQDSTASDCAKQQGIDYTAIGACAADSDGVQYEHVMAQATAALNPPHQYVPWIVIDGVHTEDLQDKCQDNLIACICDQYQGPKPASCSSVGAVRRVSYVN